MKYAFVIGSNAFIVPHGIISVASGDTIKEILKVNSVHRDSEAGSKLSVDINIEETNGASIVLNNNTSLPHGDFQITHEHDKLRVLRNDGHIIINVQQMDEETWEALEHNIVAELEISQPVAVIRVFGDFKAGDLHIMAENEKLFINNNGYATSAMHGTRELKFTADGVVLD
jgi:hypothetical protein